MEKSTPKHYYRVSDTLNAGDSVDAGDIEMPPTLAGKLRPGDGLVFARWDEKDQIGQVSAFGIVLSQTHSPFKAVVLLKSTDTTFRPNPSGRRWWRNEHFKFAESVRERYMLDDLFAEHFPDYSSLEISRNVEPRIGRTRQYQKVAGYIYILKSQYGYKIGKTVNMKDRTRLFGVKLPFKFDVEYSRHVDDYSRVEADLHRAYASSRLEGEWFALDDTDLAAIKSRLSALDA